jgi:hypothetical protein
MTEPNRVKWVGIRPTNPAEIIPVSNNVQGGTVIESVKDTDTIAGDVLLSTTPVPAGETHEITSVLAWNSVSAITRIFIQLVSGGSNVKLRRKTGPAIDEEIMLNNSVTLHAGDYLQGYFIGCILHDNIQIHIAGHKLNF